MWLEVEIEGFKVYLEDLIGLKDAIEGIGQGTILVKYSLLERGTEHVEPHEIIEGWIESLEKILKKYGEKLKLAGFRYIVLMPLSGLYKYKPKHAISAGVNMILAFYKRRPKFLDVEGFRSYP